MQTAIECLGLPLNDLRNLQRAVTSLYARLHQDPSTHCGPFFVEGERSVALNPHNSDVLFSLVNRMSAAAEWDPTVRAHVGKGAKGLQMVRKAMALNPYHPGWYYFPLAKNHYLKGEYEEALTQVQKINMPGFYWIYAYLAAVHGQMGHESKAQAAINRLLELRPEFLDDPRAQFLQWNNPDNVIDAWLEGFRKAGLDIPDEPAAAD